MLEEPLQRESERAGRVGMLVGRLHLAEDLRFAQHHGIEAAGHAQRVQYRFVVLVPIEVGFEFVAPDAVEAAQPVEHSLLPAGVLFPEVDLGAVAGRENRRLGDLYTAVQRIQRLPELNLVHGEALADLYRRSPVVDSEGEQHGRRFFRAKMWSTAG